MRECKDEVRLGTMREVSTWSLVTGRSRVDGRTKEEWSRSEGAMVDGIEVCEGEFLRGSVQVQFNWSRKRM